MIWAFFLSLPLQAQVHPTQAHPTQADPAQAHPAQAHPFSRTL